MDLGLTCGIPKTSTKPTGVSVRKAGSAMRKWNSGERSMLGAPGRTELGGGGGSVPKMCRGPQATGRNGQRRSLLVLRSLHLPLLTACSSWSD